MSFIYLKHYNKLLHFVRSILGNMYLQDLKKLQVQVQRQGASSQNFSFLNIDSGYKNQVKVICSQLL